MIKIKPYFWPFTILLMGIGTTGLLGYVGYRLNYGETAIPYLISIFGLFFALFQVSLNIQIQGIRNKTALRHHEYKDFVKLTNSISELTVAGLSPAEPTPDTQTLFTNLLNKRNEISSFIDYNDNYLLAGIKKNPTMLAIKNKAHDLAYITDSYRFRLDEINGTDSEDKVSLGMARMEWHNNLVQALQEYHQIQRKAIRVVQRYLQ